MEFWNKGKSLAEEAVKKSQELTKEAAKKSQELTSFIVASARLSDIVSETAKRSNTTKIITKILLESEWKVRRTMKLDVNGLRYLSEDDFRILAAVERGMSNRRNSFANGKNRMNSRTSLAQREEIIRRTVYVSDIDQQVTEEQLASLFINCGQVNGKKPFIIWLETMLGFYPVKILPSKTAIAPVNPTFLSRSEDEREICARTVYCTNIDKKVTQGDLKSFFETFCGEVHRLRMLGETIITLLVLLLWSLLCCALEDSAKSSWITAETMGFISM